MPRLMIRGVSLCNPPVWARHSFFRGRFISFRELTADFASRELGRWSCCLACIIMYWRIGGLCYFLPMIPLSCFIASSLQCLMLAGSSCFSACRYRSDRTLASLSLPSNAWRPTRRLRFRSPCARPAASAAQLSTDSFVHTIGELIFYIVSSPFPTRVCPSVCSLFTFPLKPGGG